MDFTYSAIPKTIFHGVLLVLSLTAGVLGGVVPRPTTPTIDNPCMIDPTSTVTPEYPPLPTQLSSTISLANTVSLKAKALKDAFVSVILAGNFLSQAEINELDSPWVNLPGLPLSLAETASDANKITLMKTAYTDLSTYIMYFREFKIQQVAYEGSELTDEMEAVISDYYVLLCSVDAALRSLNSPMTEFVTESVVSDDIKNMSNSSKRYKRNYVLTKNAMTYLSSMEMKYADLLEKLA